MKLGQTAGIGGFRPISRNNFANAPEQQMPVMAAPQNALPTDFRSKWYALADRQTALQNQKDLDQVTSQGNFGMRQGLGALGFRGNQNAGSMERLAGASARGMGAGGLAAGQSRYNRLAELYGQGLSQIELPLMQGQDMQAALNAGKSKGLLGLGFAGL